MSEIFVGIDLGTTNTLACYLKSGRLDFIKFSGKKMLPSALSVDEDGSIIVGKVAKRNAVMDPRTAVLSSKTYMADPKKTWTIRGKTFTPTEVATEILKEVKRKIIQKMKCPPETTINAVITVPAYFTGNQKDETKKAGAAAGFNVLQIITEPMAAAVAAVRTLELDEKIFVVDLGGGTFDISVLQAEQSTHTYLALDVDGDKKLGGDNFDKMLYNYLIGVIQDDLGLDLSNPEKSGLSYNEYYSMTGRVRDAAETAKIDLSSAENCEITLPALFHHQGKTYDFNIELTRADFENICAPLFDKIISRIKKFIEESDKFTLNEIGTVILAGGSCYIPKIKSEVEKIFGKRPDSQLELDTLVAVGACLVSESINAGIITPDSIHLKDIISHSLGVEVLSPDRKKMILSKIIHKGATYPCEFSKIYTTVANNQTTVPIYIYEAASDKENVEDIEVHEYYGDVSLENIPPAPAGVPNIKVTFSYDQSGAVVVMAQDENSGISRVVEIKKGEKPARKKIQAAIDFMLLLDTSGSMDGVAIREAKHACEILFTDMIDFSVHKMGFITFDSYVRRLVPLTQDVNRLKNALRDIDADGGTNLVDALKYADQDLAASSNKKVVIIVTDGDPFDENLVLHYATKMKNSGILIATIGAGNRIKEGFIKKMSSPDRAYKIDNMSKLRDAFETALLAIFET